MPLSQEQMGETGSSRFLQNTGVQNTMYQKRAIFRIKIGSTYTKPSASTEYKH
jgi:hypothetical protein